MYEAEQKQLRAIPQWNFVNLDEMLAKAAAALAANADWSAFWPTALPTSVVVLMDDSTELVKAAVEARLRRMKWHVEQGQRDFAISNQPQYVIDRVLATVLPDGWEPMKPVPFTSCDVAPLPEPKPGDRLLLLWDQDGEQDGPILIGPGDEAAQARATDDGGKPEDYHRGFEWASMTGSTLHNGDGWPTGMTRAYSWKVR